MKKFFIGAEAGCIGHTEWGYPIHDHFIIKMVDDEGQDQDQTTTYFQVREVYGLGKGGNWQEVKLTTMLRNSSDDTAYEEPVALVGGKELPLNALQKRYAITDITPLYEVSMEFKNSPYVSRAIKDGKFAIKLDGRRKNHRAILQALEEFLKE